MKNYKSPGIDGFTVENCLTCYIISNSVHFFQQKEFHVTQRHLRPTTIYNELNFFQNKVYLRLLDFLNTIGVHISMKCKQNGENTRFILNDLIAFTESKTPQLYLLVDFFSQKFTYKVLFFFFQFWKKYHNLGKNINIQESSLQRGCLAMHGMFYGLYISTDPINSKFTT